MIRAACSAARLIHPDDHVLLVAAGRTDAHGPIVMVQHHERAGRVEAHSCDCVGGQIGLLQGEPRGDGRGAPDIVGALLDEVVLRTPDFNRVHAKAEPDAGGIEQCRAHAACAHVDSEKCRR